MTQQMTSAAVRAEVAALLHLSPDELSDTDNLFDFGLDSVRLLTLIERWRDAGAEVSFVEFAEQPTIGHWMTLLAPPVPTADVT